MNLDKKTAEFGFSYNHAYLSVHCRFRVNDALAAIIEQIHGVEWVNIDGKYRLNLEYGKMFTQEEIKAAITEKINEFLADQ